MALRPVALRVGIIAVAMALPAVIIGLSFGAVVGMAVACAVAVAVIARDTASQFKLLTWLKHPKRTNLPEGSGAWAEVYYRSARQLRIWEGRVAREEEKLRRFIEALQASPNGVVLVDGAGQIDWCNDTAAEHFGLDPVRDLRQHAVHLIRNPEFFAYMAAKRFEEPLLMRRNGRLGGLLLSVQVIPYGDGERLLLSRDVTQIERTEAMRRDFVANVSHEIKTPLTVVAGFVESLRSLDFTPEERDRILGLMQEQSDRMRRLVDDLLTLAHLEGDPHQPGEEIIDMQQMVSRLGAEARALSRGRHRIEVDAAPERLRGSLNELTSAFTNLVTNAVRYTPAGGEIHIVWRVQHPDRGEFSGEFAVTDSGIGIAAEHIPRLTERFYRVDRSRSRDSGGTGLGLAIVKHVLMRHQAELRVSSELGKGSTFVARFPAQRLAGSQVGQVLRESISA